MRLLTWIGAVVVILAAGYFFFQEELGFGQPVLKEFAVKDTAEVSKIFLSDTEGRNIDIQRADDQTWWAMDGTTKRFRVRDDAIQLMLKTISRIEMKNPVAKPALDNVIRMIAGRNTRVEIYTSDEKPEKIWYVGGATPDNFGTYMLLETVEDGKSKLPFITHLPGNYGYLSTRFFTDSIEWKYTGLFDKGITDIKTITVNYPPQPENSFRIDYNGGNDIKLYDLSKSAFLTTYDTVAVKNYMLGYKKVHFESYPRHLSLAQQDSILSTGTVFSIEVAYGDGITRKVRAHYMEDRYGDRYDDPKIEKTEEEQEEEADRDRLYALINEKEFVGIQYFVFNKLLVPLEEFKGSSSVEN